MEKVAIIGDIHGCSKTLQKLLNYLPKDITTIYSVGDLIDRGPDSKGVVQLCIDNNIKAVRGNHEDMLLDFLDENSQYEKGLFEINGGVQTIESYGGDCYFIKDMYGYSPPSYKSSVTLPDEHLKYIKNMPIFIETDDFILSHAGIHPIIAKGDFGKGKWDDNSIESNSNLMWNREGVAPMEKIQIIGHTPDYEIQYIKTWGELAAINIDTACGKISNAKLTAIIMPTQEIMQVICEEM